MPTYAGTALYTTCTFYQASAPPPAGSPVDPTTITLKFAIQGQAATTWTYGGAGSIVRLSTGLYAATIPTDGLLGPFTVEWIGTGNSDVIIAISTLIEAPPL